MLLFGSWLLLVDFDADFTFSTPNKKRG